MPITTARTYVLLLVCLAVLAGCERTHSRKGPPVLRAIPPQAAESVPDTREEIREARFAPELAQLHRQMLGEAQTYFSQGDYSHAISGLKRVLALQPQGSVEQEGRWLLAQSYGFVGEWESARDQYRKLASSDRPHPYQQDARAKLKELEVLLEEFKAPPLETHAIRLSLEQLPTNEGFDQGIKKMKEDGITTLLVDLGCQGGWFHTDRQQGTRGPHDIGSLQSLLRSYIERSHRLQLLVYLGVNLRCLGNWADSPRLEWRDRSYDVSTQSIETTAYFDIFHPDYQVFLQEFFTRLSGENVDGLVFLDDYPLGVYDGLSPAGLSLFQRAFNVNFDPARVFHPDFHPLRSVKSSKRTGVHSGGSAEDSIFWRWAGWKARERLTVFENVIRHLRTQHFTVQCGLELHPHGLTDPVRALVEYAQDAMEATRRPFSFFFVRPEIDRQSAFDQRTAIEKLRRISTNAILTRLLPVLDDPRRVWVSMPAESGKRLAPGHQANTPSVLREYPTGIGVVHDLRAFS